MPQDARAQRRPNGHPAARGTVIRRRYTVVRSTPAASAAAPSFHPCEILLMTCALPVVGWREWVALPGFGLSRVLAKIDTGARSCALHVDAQRSVMVDGVEHVAFVLRPGDGLPASERLAPVVDRRAVMDSGGHVTERIFIRTTLVMGRWQREIEVNLTDRRGLRHPMLVGRTALVGAWVVDPSRDFVLPAPEHAP